MKKILLTLVASALMAGTAWAGFGPQLLWQPEDIRNESIIVQTGKVSWAEVTQNGDQSYSTINQSGTDDKAVVKQTSSCCVAGHCGCHGGWVPIYWEDEYQNYSSIEQKNTGFHDAYVEQNGDGNKSTITQSGAKDKAYVKQLGGFNESKIAQSGLAVNDAKVFQTGDLNYSEITQKGVGSNTALVDQNGFGNLSYITQDAAVSVNSATVHQTGYNNLSNISQSGIGCHTAIVNQTNLCYTGSVPYCK